MQTDAKAHIPGANTALLLPAPSLPESAPDEAITYGKRYLSHLHQLATSFSQGEQPVARYLEQLDSVTESLLHHGSHQLNTLVFVLFQVLHHIENLPSEASEADKKPDSALLNLTEKLGKHPIFLVPDDPESYTEITVSDDNGLCLQVDSAYIAGTALSILIETNISLEKYLDTASVFDDADINCSATITDQQCSLNIHRLRLQQASPAETTDQNPVKLELLSQIRISHQSLPAFTGVLRLNASIKPNAPAPKIDYMEIDGDLETDGQLFSAILKIDFTMSQAFDLLNFFMQDSGDFTALLAENNAEISIVITAKTSLALLPVLEDKNLAQPLQHVILHYLQHAKTDQETPHDQPSLSLRIAAPHQPVLTLQKEDASPVGKILIDDQLAGEITLSPPNTASVYWRNGETEHLL